MRRVTLDWWVVAIEVIGPLCPGQDGQEQGVGGMGHGQTDTRILKFKYDFKK